MSINLIILLSFDLDAIISISLTLVSADLNFESN